MGIEALGKDAFLNLLTTQLQHQDPLKPMESTEFIAQLAQFRELESSIETNKKLDLLVDRTNDMNSLSAASLLGRKVEIMGGGTAHEPGKPETISYRLQEDTNQVVVHVINQAGSVVRTLTMNGLQNKGAHELVWDGKDYQGNMAPSGTYTYSGSSIREGKGSPMPIEIGTQGEVMGISYEDGKVLASVNGMSVPVSEIVKILR